MISMYSLTVFGNLTLLSLKLPFASRSLTTNFLIASLIGNFLFGTEVFSISVPVLTLNQSDFVGGYFENKISKFIPSL
jgi:hypothetical protein